MPRAIATAAGVENEPGAYPAPPLWLREQDQYCATRDSNRKSPRRNGG